MSDRLRGALVVLSGASGGFGRELTRLLVLDHGCTVIGVGRSGEKMEALKNSLGSDGARFSYRLFDVRERDSWKRLASDLRASGLTPDLLINNAGILPRFSSYLPGDFSVLKDTMDTDFYATVYSTEELLPLLLASPRGMLYNVASASSYFPIVGTAAYCAAKGAVYNFTLALRSELHGRLTVGLFCPGFSNTDIFRYQAETKPAGVVSRVCSDPRHVARRMVRAMKRGRAVTNIGVDAHFMRFFACVCPTAAFSATRAVLKRSGLSLFSGIFDRRSGKND